MKIAFIINGQGGVGKDSFVESISCFWKVKNISSITPIKEIMKTLGWQGTKTDKDRKFMSDLKQLITDYNDYPTQYCFLEYKKFLKDDNDLMFIHIREPNEIKKLVDMSNGEIKTLLIRRKEIEHVYGNKSDDQVLDFDYDYCYNNCTDLKSLPLSAKQFIEQVVGFKKYKLSKY